jgi:small subunit ribosomal protein S5
LSIRRVTRVVSGGRRFSFSVAMLIGDKKGSVGLGLGKSSDTTMAINKAVSSAKKNMFKIATNKDMSLSHSVEGKFKASRVMLMPNNGKGLVVGGAIRDIMMLGGLKNVSGKIFSRSKTHLNNAKAAIIALKTLKPARKEKVVAVEEVVE